MKKYRSWIVVAFMGIQACAISYIALWLYEFSQVVL